APVDERQAAPHQALDAAADVIPAFQGAGPGLHLGTARPRDRRKRRQTHHGGNDRPPPHEQHSFITESVQTERQQKNAGPARTASPEKRFTHGTVTAQVTKLASTVLPLSSDASVTVQLKSAATAADAPRQVLKFRVITGACKPPSLTEVAVNA